MRSLKLPILAALVAATLGGVAFAGAPPLLNNQGVLLNPAGGPVPDGTYALTFSLYATDNAVTPLWSETVAGVATQSGLYTVTLGGSGTPLAPALFADSAALWLGIRVDGDTELPRRRLLSVPFSLESSHAATATAASGLACSGCVGEGALSFSICEATMACALDGVFAPAPHTHPGTDITSPVAKATEADSAAIAGSLGCTGCVASTHVGFGYAGSISKGGPATSALDADKLGGKLPDAYAASSHTHSGGDITSPVAEASFALDAAAVGGKTAAGIQADVLAAVGAAGYLAKTDPIGQGQLPGNGLDEVSNGLLTNQFVDSISSGATPVPIPDQSPLGVSDTIQFPDIGIAEKLTVSVDISNSNVSGIQVTLTAPDGATYVLYDGGSSGPKLATSYPDPTATLTGNLLTWVGKNPQGAWTLKVVDKVFLNNTTDGQINSWSINLQTLSTKKVALKGNLILEGTLTAPGAISVGGDLAVTGQLACTGCVAKGALDTPTQQALVPKGAVMFFNLASCPAGWAALSGAQGRYLVGMPPGGTLGGTAGTALSNLENRPVGQHTHGVNDPGHAHTVYMDNDTAPDGGTGATASEDSPDVPLSTASSTTGITIQSTGAVAGTNAPYVQLLVCEKL